MSEIEKHSEMVSEILSAAADELEARPLVSDWSIEAIETAVAVMRGLADGCTPEPDYEAQQREFERNKFWRDAWTATASVENSTSADVCTKYADAALIAYDARFGQEVEI